MLKRTMRASMRGRKKQVRIWQPDSGIVMPQ